jgi:replicative superfamily II helicase
VKSSLASATSRMHFRVYWGRIYRHTADALYNEGFERIEHLLLAEQKHEIADLKKRVKRIEDALAV